MLISAETQKTLKFNYGRKSLRLDVFAEDAAKRLFNFEVQRRPEGAPPDRVACHCAALRIASAAAGRNFDELPDVFVIFFFEKDPFKQGKPVYHVNLRFDDNKPLGSHEHIIYVNGEFRDTTTQIGKLIHDFYCANYEDMLIPEMALAVKLIKTDEVYMEVLSDIIEARIAAKIEAAQAEARADEREKTQAEDQVKYEKLLAEEQAKYEKLLAEEQAKIRSEEQAKIHSEQHDKWREIVQNMLNVQKFSREKIAECLNLSLNEVNAFLV